MKKYLLLLIPNLCFATQYTHVDYVTGNSITAAGQNANENGIGTIINGNLDTGNLSASAGILGTQLANQTVTTTQISSNTVTDANISQSANIWGSKLANGSVNTGQLANQSVTGSTANSGGTSGIINLSSISTPDFRANAVTISTGSFIGTTGGLGGLTTTDTTQLTTIGGKVLVAANMNVQITAGASGPGLTVVVSTGSTNLPGGRCTFDYTIPTSGNVTMPCSIYTIVSLAAGTYTFTFQYGLDNGSLGPSGVVNHSMVVTELRD